MHDQKKKAVFFWSGGKDSALCLYRVCQQKEYEVVALVTTLSEKFKRISMHGVREEMVEMQARAIGIPLFKMYVSEGTNAEYEKRVEETLLRFREQGVTHVIYGDIFLEDLRAYRDSSLSKFGMQGVYPLWKQDTKKLIGEFLSLGFKTITCCINDAYMGESRVGEVIDEKYISTLPSNVDPCGENGEFHTFCFDGPLFRHPVKYKKGVKIFRPLVLKATDDQCKPIVETRGFWFCELVGDY
jgi:uncharacterized protein (TIGR00290 family)